jgi:SAM-dependent methyltransferase
VSVHPSAARGFAQTAADYERSRPSYPDAAVDHIRRALGLAPGRTVVDVAAGTGKLTRLLTRSGAAVLAVEPIAEMREVLASACPGVEVRSGVAERLPLPDASVDAVTVAQAFHWFDGRAALGEFSRVLAPGGGVAVVFNRRDGRPAWLAAVNEVVEAHRAGEPHHHDGRWRDAFTASPSFTELEDTSFDNPQVLSPEEVVARFRSLSFVGALGATGQGALLAQIAHILASHPDTAGRTELVIPQTTVVSISRRC